MYLCMCVRVLFMCVFITLNLTKCIRICVNYRERPLFKTSNYLKIYVMIFHKIFNNIVSDVLIFFYDRHICVKDVYSNSISYLPKYY